MAMGINLFNQQIQEKLIMRSDRTTVSFLPRSISIGVLTLGLILCSAGLMLAAPGDLDLTFGNGGKVVTQFNQNARALAMAILPNGKIIAAGFVGDSGVSFALAKYNQDGSRDTSFGSGGLVQTGMNGNSEIHGVAIQPDGKIIVAGFNRNDFALARYNPNGSLDTTFGVLGIVTTPVGTSPSARAETISIQPDGKIIAAGYCQNTMRDMALVRYNADGTLDNSFGTNGKVITSNPTGSAINKIKIQTDGKIFAVGSLQTTGGGSSYIIARFETGGDLDISFGTQGKVTTPISGVDMAYDIAIQTDGRYVVVGNAGSNFGVVRYNTDGSLDTSFGTTGIVTINLHTSSSATGVAIQPDGKIIVAGMVLGSSEYDFGVVRYTANGVLDTSFGTDGRVTTSLLGHDFVTAVGIHSDGRIVAAGYLISSVYGTNFGLARFLGDVVNRTTFDFDGDGKADQSVFRNGAWYLLRSQDGFVTRPFGISTDMITPADFDGDGITDISVFRDGFWYILRSQGGYQGIPFGIAGDIPLPADYDGDGKADLAVYRNGTWHILQSTLGYTSFQFGNSTDRPVPADYDGDGKTDAAVYRNGVWYILRSTTGFTTVPFGVASDRPLVGDFDGDSKADQALYRSGVWYVLGSSQGFFATQFGIATDIPVPADYDGDLKTDIAVFRDGIWHILGSQQGFTSIQFGTTGDRPIPAGPLP